LSALVVAVLLVGEVAVYVTWRRPDSVADHLAVLQDNWLVGLLTLDLLGMIAYLALIPTMLALHVALREGHEAAMAVTTVVYLVGVADFFATNTAFPMLDLSSRYAEATTVTERHRSSPPRGRWSRCSTKAPSSSAHRRRMLPLHLGWRPRLLQYPRSRCGACVPNPPSVYQSPDP
jgi:hypothetical protein